MFHRIAHRSGVLRPRSAVIVAALSALVLAMTATSSAQVPLPGASVTVCQVTGSVGALNYLQVSISVDQVAAYLNQFPGSFVGTCPASGGSTGGSLTGAVTVCKVSGSVSSPIYNQVSVAVDQVALYLNQNPGSFAGTCPAGSSGSGSGSGTGTGTLPNGSLTVCSISGSVSAPTYAQANVAVSDLAAYLNRSPGFVGSCPTAGDPNGNPGPVPTGYVTICKVTGNASVPYATATVPETGLQAYLSQAGTILVLPSGGCPTTAPAAGTTAAPSSTTAGSTSTVVVNTTPNTVVTAKGAGVNESTTSDANGQAKLQIKAKKKGIVTIRGAGGRVLKKLGVTGARKSGANLTG